MIALIRGPGGPVRRAAAEVVPLLVAGAIAWMAVPFLRWGAVVVGLATWVLVSWGLVRVRRHPRARLLWRIALTAHVLFWSACGVSRSTLREPGPVDAAEAVGWAGATGFRAGYAEVPFDLPDRVPLAGYGGRQRRRALPAFGGFGVLGSLSRASMDPSVPMLADAATEGSSLGARALVLAPEPASAGPAFAVVRLDLVVVDEAVVESILHAAKDLGSGLDRSTLVVCANHTHCGPGGCHTSPLAQVVGTDHLRPDVVEAVVGAAVDALSRATANRAPARLALADSADAGPDGRPILARNRRRPDPDAIDPRVMALRIETDAGILALLLNYAVHPTVYGQGHLSLSADLAGAIEAAVSERLPGRPPVLFVNGALGDVAPRRDAWGADVRPEEIAAPFAERVAEDLLRGDLHSRISLRGAAVRRDLGSPHAFAATGSRALFDEDVATSAVGADAPAVLASVLSLPVNVPAWSLGLSEMRFGFSFRGTIGATVNLEHAVDRRHRAFGAWVLRTGDGSEGRSLLWLPGEATQALGKRWRERVAREGHPPAFLLGLTNGSMAYLADEQEFDRGGYEAAFTLYGRNTATLVEEALFAALDAAAR